MGIKSGPRHGSLQIWPRKRADKILPSANWHGIISRNIAEKPGMLGFIGYKAGMRSAYVKDNTANSMTKNKKIIVPCTIIECPTMKIFSVRFYRNGLVLADVINENPDKELKRKVKLPKQIKTKELLEKIEKEGRYDDIRVIAYSQVKKTGLKKTPDIAEIAIAGSTKEEKLCWVKEHLAKEIPVGEIFSKGLVDIRAVTKGKGFQGPVKRFGIRLRSHKAEKGQRRAGSIGPWHPARLTFYIPLAGQVGFFTRVVYNSTIIEIGKGSEKNVAPSGGFNRYGNLKTDYLILRGSVQGAAKRQILITRPLRPTKKQARKQYELVELR